MLIISTDFRLYLLLLLFLFYFPCISLGQADIAKKMEIFYELMVENPNKAIEVGQELVEFHQKNGNWQELADVQVTMAYLYLQEREIDSLAANLTYSLFTYQTNKLDTLTYSYYALWNLHGIYYDLIRHPKTIETVKREINLAEKLNAMDGQIEDYSVGVGYQNLGVQYARASDYFQAISYYKKALSYLQEHPHKLAETYNNIGRSYRFLKDYTAARKHYDSALYQLDLAQRKHPKIAFQSYQNITELYQEMSKFDSAAVYNQLTIQQLAVDDFIRRGDAKLMRAKIKLATNAYATSSIELNESLELYRMAYPLKHPKLARVYQVKAQLAVSLNNHPRALQHLQKAITALVWNFNDSLNYQVNPTLDQEINDKPLLLEVLIEKAASLHTVGEKQLALETYLLAIDLVESMLKNYHATGSKFTLLEKVVPLYEAAIGTALQLDKTTIAFALAERNKAFLLLHNIKNLQAQDLAKINPADLEQEQALKIKIAFNERELFRARRDENEAKEKQFQQRIFDLKQQLQQLLERLEQQNPTYYQLKYNLQSVPLATLQTEQLKPNQVLIEYFLGDSMLYIFAVTRDKVQTYQVSKAREVQQLMQKLRINVSQPSTQQVNFVTFAQTAKQLYNTILQPVLQQNTDTFKELIIVPDGVLGYLPFQILVINDDWKEQTEPRYDKLAYLLYDYQISYTYSATFLQEVTYLQTLQQSKAKQVGLFAPIFKGQPAIQRDGEQLDNLLYSQREVASIDSIVNGQLFLAQAANINNFQQNLSEYKILHLSTHASVDDQNPLNSRIHFSDDYLNTNEIYNLPLSAELVVLSACNTGGGQLRRGEGILSLARAFAYAGCPSMVTSLWKVNDVQTSELMIDFYKNLFTTQTKDAALRAAQLNYINNIQSYENAHPYYWGAFVQIGLTNAVIMPINYKWVWLLIGLSILVMIGVWLRYRSL